MPPKSPPPAAAAPAARRQSAGVKAGSADDNLQFNAFLGFVEKNRHLGLRCDVSQRVVVSVRDRKGLPLADADVLVIDGGRTLARRRTYADGRALIFPSEDEAQPSQSAMVRISYGSKTRELPLAPDRQHRIDVELDLTRETFSRVPLDIAFVLDTTGSMGDEIEQLKRTLDHINFQISNLTPAPEVRFGMVLYRDRGDDYVTKVVPFTADVKGFASELAKVRAGGGGDTPEDVQEGLHQAVKTLKWRSEGLKLAFLIGDAPPHLDYGQTYTYVSAMREAARRGIKIATIGCSGLDLMGEVVWRQIAQYTMAPFVFLTHGEKGDSEGSPSTVSHHVGSNWVAENLDAIVIRMVKVELAHYSPRGAQPLEDYFSARVSERLGAEEVLQDLFRQSVKQLIDYSVQRIADRTPTIVLPIRSGAAKLKSLVRPLETQNRIRYLAEERGYQPRRDAGSFNSSASNAYGEMAKDAKEENLILHLDSSWHYRTVDRQRYLFTTDLNKHESCTSNNYANVINGNCDSEIDRILSTRSIPGYSKHHTGLAIDLACGTGGSLTGFGSTSCFTWISKNNYCNAKKHGFIPSYPEGAGDQGPDPEAWEYIWVGIENLKK